MPMLIDVRKAGIIICLFIWYSFPSSQVLAGGKYGGDACLACHEDVWVDAGAKRYVHRPFAKKDCKYCHAANPDPLNSNPLAPYIDKVKWIGKDVNPAKEHWFYFNVGKRGATLLVDAESADNVRHIEEIELPPFDEVENTPEDNGNPPIVSRVRVVEVRRDIFMSATIGWETDKPSNSRVLYGAEKLDLSSMLDDQYTKTHSITLNGVKPNTNYKFSVVSEDAFGNRVESREYNLLTVTGGAANRRNNSSFTNAGEITLVNYIYRSADKYVVKISANMDVTMALGILPKKYMDNDVNGAGKEIVRHMITNSESGTNIGICYSCHVEYKKILTHPVNVYPKTNMKIPPEYALLSDGRISCMSCHATHASNIKHRLIKASKRDLCLGCHKEML